AFTVSVELLPEVTEVGLTMAVAPLGVPLTARLTVPALPLVTAVEMVLVALEPCAMLNDVGDALMEKSGGGAVTVTLAVTLRLPLAAVTVKVPGVEPAVNKPDVLMVPPPLTDQVKVGGGFIGWPN